MFSFHFVRELKTSRKLNSATKQIVSGLSSSVTNECSTVIFKITFEENSKTAESAVNDNIIICEVAPYFRLFVMCRLPSGSMGEACDLGIITTVKYRRNTCQSLKLELQLKFLSNSYQ